MLKLAGGLLTLVGLSLGAGCSQQEVVAELRSLSGSEDAVFLCRDANGVGHPFAECPDRNLLDDAHPADKLSVVALVSQTVTDEVAVVDVTAGHVVDADPATPGYGFLRVGGRPVSLATTPGGTASFVATADVGHNGIFGLPTKCLGAPAAGKPARDLTTWPACRLDDTPGEMAVIVDEATVPSSMVDPAARCNVSEYTAKEIALAESGECSANLAADGGPSGRRKLVVALPDKGELVVIDAQSLLNLPPGTFPNCEIERHIPLEVQVPAGVTQQLPPDLQTTCSEVPAPTAPAPSKASPQPAGFALADKLLYVADQKAPVIHVLSAASACNMTELSPLLPMSLREPSRVVTTRRVAVSPLTPDGKRYAYAIDTEDQPGASVMAFDVSPGATDRTPLVRAGSPELPNEKPDRLALASSAKDVTFAYRDIPYVDPATGAATFGARCDPDPAKTETDPIGALARPSSDLLTGARPGLLRGLFGFILLTNGSIAIVDVDDFDSQCRRPIGANSSAEADFRGCAGDQLVNPDASATTAPNFTSDYSPTGTPFVTNEVSCRVVEPHRFRSAFVSANDATVGVRAPSLRSFPQLTLPAATATSAPEDRPRLLAVPFPSSTGAPTDVFVGSTRFSTAESASDFLPTDPNSTQTEQLQTLNSVVLPPLEPRSYASEDNVSLTYEGSYAGDHTAGFLAVIAGTSTGELKDSSLSFCAAGVYDQKLMAEYGRDVLGVKAEDAETFGVAHGDYVQITSAVPAEDDTYWAKSAKTFSDCSTQFGPNDIENLQAERELAITSAFADRLEVSPRADSNATLSDLLTCFPTSQTYRLRAGAQWVLLHSSSGFRHDVITSGTENACIRSCNPLNKWSKSRVFEISSSTCASPGEAAADPFALRVGCAADEVACVYDQTKPGPGSTTASGSAVTLTGDASQCIFTGLNDRFALYRGRVASVRDASFSWQTTGGFLPLTMSLTSISTVVAPQSIQFLQQPEEMAVVDGASQGLSLFSLDTFAIVRPSPFY
jgi:hypothetical protein